MAGHDGLQPVALDTDARATLAAIKRDVALAEAALDDEREGDFTRAVELLAQRAASLLALVRAW